MYPITSSGGLLPISLANLTPTYLLIYPSTYLSNVSRSDTTISAYLVIRARCSGVFSVYLLEGVGFSYAKGGWLFGFGLLLDGCILPHAWRRWLFDLV